MRTSRIIDKVSKARAMDLQWNRLTKTHDEIEVIPYVFERRGVVMVSTEDGGLFADYYGEFRGGFPWISIELQQIAQELGMFWEWENPGCIGLYLD